jgi:hypothetical protein
MKKIAYSIVCLFAILTLASCTFAPLIVRPSQHVIREERTLGAFSKVSASAVGELDITQGDSVALTIEADDNLMPYLTSDIHGDTLELGLETGTSLNITGTATVKYHLTVKDLEAISISGMVGVSSGPLVTDSLRVIISGSGNVSIASLTANSLNVTLSGMGDLTIAGEVTDQKIEISGTGAFHGGDLRSQTAEITVSGMGDATLWATATLDVHISGSATIGYYGSPHTTQEISGIGSVNDLGSK